MGGHACISGQSLGLCSAHLDTSLLSHWHQEPLRMEPNMDLLPLTLFLSDTDPSNSGAEITSASKSHVSAASSQKVLWESLHCSLCIDLGERSARASTSHVTAVPREPHTLSDLSKVWKANCSGSHRGEREAAYRLPPPMALSTCVCLTSDCPSETWFSAPSSCPAHL